MKQLSYSIIIILFSLSLTSHAQKTIFPNGYIESELPNQDEWFELNGSNKECEVSIQNDSLKISQYKYTRKKEITNYGGKIIGVNRGEWGGSLTFQPNDKKLKEIEIKKGNILFLFCFNNKIFFIESLSHKYQDEGSFYELNYIDGVFSYKKIFDFDDAPQAMTIFENKIFIVSSASLYIIENMKKQTIFKDLFWGGLNPNSIVLEDAKNVFIGIRGGFVKLNLEEKSLKFYKSINKH